MKEIEAIFKYLQTQMHAGYSVDENINYVRVSKPNYFQVAEYLRKHGFRRLLTISAVDWIERGTFEIYFIVHKLHESLYVKVATEVPRDNPTIPSLSKLWLNAAMHEREAWELFGVSFEGNQILKPLFLEDPIEIPPFRKDFDWREYVEKNYSLAHNKE
ncbi:MAG: NADH-quinone oxidoreductase subunit C [Promethearchaeota archaeon]